MTTRIKSITYQIPSATDRTRAYTVSVNPEDGRMRCTCPARRQCWHEKAIIAGVAPKPRIRISVGG